MRNFILFIHILLVIILAGCSGPGLKGKYMADVSKEMDSLGLIVLFEFGRDSVVGYTSFIDGQDTSTEQAFTGSYKVVQDTVVISYNDAVGDNTFKLCKKGADTLVEKGAKSDTVYHVSVLAAPLTRTLKKEKKS